MSELQFPFRVALSEEPQVLLHVELEPDGALSMVTLGLSELHHQELLWTFADPDVDVRVAVEIFGYAVEQAKLGNPVEAGGLTELGGNGLFGDARRCGIAYGPGHDLGPMLLEAGLPASSVLRMHALWESEVQAAHAFGVPRVLNMLGQQARFFPFPSRDVLTRPPCVTEDELAKSPLHQASRVGGFFGAAAFSMNRTVFVIYSPGRGPALAAALREVGGAVLPTPTDPELCREALVWQPGRGPAVISGASDADATVQLDDRRIAGTWVMLGPGDTQGARIVEDGFLVLVKEKHWEPVLDQLSQGNEFELSHHQDDLMPVRFVPRVAAAPVAPSGVELTQVVLVSDEERIGRNLAPAQIQELVASVLAILGRLEGHAEGDAVLEVLLSTDRGPAIAVRGPLQGADVAELERALSSLSQPRTGADKIALELHVRLHAKH